MVSASKRHRDLVQYNWYRYAVSGFTPLQHLKYGRNVRYYAQLVRATPKWANLRSVWDMFLYSAVCRAEGFDMETDHIVPANHPYVCGLHCKDNLQHLTSGENNRKSNRRWPGMWDDQLELELCRYSKREPTEEENIERYTNMR